MASASTERHTLDSLMNRIRACMMIKWDHPLRVQKHLESQLQTTMRINSVACELTGSAYRIA